MLPINKWNDIPNDCRVDCSDDYNDDDDDDDDDRNRKKEVETKQCVSTYWSAYYAVKV